MNIRSKYSTYLHLRPYKEAAMPDPQILTILAITAILPCLTFLLGWNIAEDRERQAKRVLDSNLKLAIKQKQELILWVRNHWPDEYTAYHRGHTEGYQQGVLQSPRLDDTP